MKKVFLPVLAAFFSLCAFAQNDNKVTIGTIDSIQSTILNEQRKIWIYVPNSGQADSRQRYPVVYLLDGDGHFSSVVGMIQQLSTVNGNMICPEMIVVGIPNTDRTRDLTPTHVDADPPFMDSAFSKTSGGGEQFISFMEKELMLYIEKTYPAAPYKMLIGHSFGGLSVMQTFVHHTNLFNAYVCIDPSMWWDRQTLLKQTKQFLAGTTFKGTSLFLGIANTMEDGMTIDQVMHDTTITTKHIRSILTLKEYFENNAQNGLKYKGKYYHEDTHGSVPLITEYDALHFLFDFYPLKLSFKDYTDTSAALADKFENHFSNVSQHMGYNISAPENIMNGMGYEALSSKQFNKAERFFSYNVSHYPESANVHDSMGDYYEAVGDTAKAIQCFEKALAINENTGTRKKLDKLLGK